MAPPLTLDDVCCVALQLGKKLKRIVLRTQDANRRAFQQSDDLQRKLFVVQVRVWELKNALHSKRSAALGSQNLGVYVWI